MQFRIERMVPDQWERVKAVRLRALIDAPDAFGATLEEVQALPLGAWKTRLEATDAATFLAEIDGEDVGLVVGKMYDELPDTAGLFSMWVAPEARGAGVGGALVDAVIDWARAEGTYRKILLDVADENLAAIRLYESRQFLRTGVSGTLPPPRENIMEHERARKL